jgi:hypothetical protein
MNERAEKERTDRPSPNERKLIPQIGLDKYDQVIGPKRRRGVLITMAAQGVNVDHVETSYEALAQPRGPNKEQPR